MFLSDTGIKHAIKTGGLVIEPYDESRVQPASYDLTLDRFFKRYPAPPRYQTWAPIHDVKEPVEMVDEEVRDGYSFLLVPGEFALASTQERVEIPVNMIGRLEGKSSIGRLGLMAHVTAGFFDPGFKGYPTLELFNASPRQIRLWPGMLICQMSFAILGSHVEHPYGSSELGSKYQNQERGPKASQYHRNFEDGSSSS